MPTIRQSSSFYAIEHVEIATTCRALGYELQEIVAPVVTASAAYNVAVGAFLEHNRRQILLRPPPDYTALMDSTLAPDLDCVYESLKAAERKLETMLEEISLLMENIHVKRADPAYRSRL